MEKVYMNSDQYRNRRNQWQSEDVSPYDLREDSSLRNMNQLDYYDASDDEFDFEAIENEMENEDYPTNPENGSMDENGCTVYEKKTVVEETEPQKTTTTWIKITRCRNCPNEGMSNK